MKIKILLENKEQFLAPKKGTEKSAAYDLYVQEDVVIKKGRQIVPTGFAIELDPDTAAEIRPRSGYSSKGMEGHAIKELSKVLTVSGNSIDAILRDEQYISLLPQRFNADVITGLADEDYRNEIGIIVINNSHEDFLIKRGARIAQMLIVNVPKTEIEIVEELSESDRKGGFGSTGV